MKHNLLKRASLPILGIILALLLSGWSWNPETILAVPAEGNWSGTTSRGYPVSFTVNPSGTQWTNFKLKTNFNFGFCSGTIEITAFGPGNIISDQFSADFGNFAFTGQFPTTGTASGTYAFTNYFISGCGAFLTQSGTWTATVPLPTFADVPFSHWAHDWIERLYNAKITGGCGTNPLMYCPGTSVTRAQMAVFLLKGIHGSSYTPPAVGASTGFNDVPTSYWAASWIKQLAAEKITGGCGAGNYCPDYPVTRDQMAVFLLKAKYTSAYTPPPVGSSTGFTDVPTDYWSAAWIKQLAAEAITGGCGTGIYCPTSPVTRDQMAVFLVKTFSLP